jgi:hypothetical protein
VCRPQGGAEAGKGVGRPEGWQGEGRSSSADAVATCGGGCSRCCRRCIHDPSCVLLPYCCSWLLLLALLLPVLLPLLLWILM